MSSFVETSRAALLPLWLDLAQSVISSPRSTCLLKLLELYLEELRDVL